MFLHSPRNSYLTDKTNWILMKRNYCICNEKHEQLLTIVKQVILGLSKISHKRCLNIKSHIVCNHHTSGTVMIRKRSTIPGVMINQYVEKLPEGKTTPDFIRKPTAITVNEGKALKQFIICNF